MKHKGTWFHPVTKCWMQCDYILTQKKEDWINCRSVEPRGYHLDHLMVVGTFVGRPWDEHCKYKKKRRMCPFMRKAQERENCRESERSDTSGSS